MHHGQLDDPPYEPQDTKDPGFSHYRLLRHVREYRFAPNTDYSACFGVAHGCFREPRSMGAAR